ncbi:MAG: TusE/DsrC/DsvC family sulfur relay protein [Candidatus Zixiibacteriota bacterium]|nr:MAG: TusE/DsrC/DsvC family sulfur relay protein [candidate division Zixibacteria bacterium]
MKIFEYNSKTYEVDSHGFLMNPDDWDEDFAEGMASSAHIRGGLTEAHWKVIRFIRNTFEKINHCPLVYIACKKNEIGLGDLKELFPTGYLRGACKLAGVTYREGYGQRIWLEEHMVHNTRMYERKNYATDVHGFLINPKDWDENFAIHKAHELNMPEYLTKEHWKIINFLRVKYAESHIVPTVYATCEANHIDLDDLERLFPHGYHRGAVKIAGLHAR